MGKKTRIKLNNSRNKKLILPEELRCGKYSEEGLRSAYKYAIKAAAFLFLFNLVMICVDINDTQRFIALASSSVPFIILFSAIACFIKKQINEYEAIKDGNYRIVREKVVDRDYSKTVLCDDAGKERVAKGTANKLFRISEIGDEYYTVYLKKENDYTKLWQTFSKHKFNGNSQFKKLKGKQYEIPYQYRYGKVTAMSAKKISEIIKTVANIFCCIVVLSFFINEEIVPVAHFFSRWGLSIFCALRAIASYIAYKSKEQDKVTKEECTILHEKIIKKEKGIIILENDLGIRRFVYSTKMKNRKFRKGDIGDEFYTIFLDEKKNENDFISHWKVVTQKEFDRGW